LLGKGRALARKSTTRFIVVAGGVISGVGKGVVTGSIGRILKEYGYKTTLIKIDPYINFDAGTLRPTEHGEVWVTEDGGEIDQDLGTYERFMDISIPKKNNITTGQIYKAVIDRERAGEYLGKTVQLIPHITDEIIKRIMEAAEGYEVAVIEIGGTAGDYENGPFLFALKSLERELGANHMLYALVTYLPVPSHIDEMKTKPTQQAIRLLGEHGIMPDFIICRSQFPLDAIRREKIELFANLPSDRIIAAPDVASVYHIPLELEQQGLGTKLLEQLNLPLKHKPDWTAWRTNVDHIKNPQARVKIAITGKYVDSGSFSLTDSYLSICHALTHAGAELNVGIDITWIDAKLFEKDTEKLTSLSEYHGVIVPGGFGNSGVEGKINVIEYARKHNIPFVGLCYGLQLAAVEYARNVCHLEKAHTTEVDPHTPYPIIDVLPLQKRILEEGKFGGTMRLGAYEAMLKPGTKVYDLYQTLDAKLCVCSVYERHRHRYEVNPAYVDILEKNGLVFSGMHQREDGTKLMEFVELPNHPFFVATQAHPEFKSRLGNPNPIFYGFVKACMPASFWIAQTTNRAVMNNL
jgi:CTP synthase